MRVFALLISLAAFVFLPVNAFAVSGPDEPEEIVITLDDLDRFAQAMLRIYALSNEVTLRVGARQEDLQALHGEFNQRAMRILDDWGLTLTRYNDIERASQLIPNIFREIAARVQSSDQQLQDLARTPTSLDDARKLLQGRVSYPVSAANFPWLADRVELESLAQDHMTRPGSRSMLQFPSIPRL